MDTLRALDTNTSSAKLLHTGLHTVLPPHQLCVLVLARVAIGFGVPHIVAYSCAM